MVGVQTMAHIMNDVEAPLSLILAVTGWLPHKMWSVRSRVEGVGLRVYEHIVGCR